AATGTRRCWHRDRRVNRGVGGLLEFGQCRGDYHGDRVAAVYTEPAGSDGGFQAELQRVVTPLGRGAIVARLGIAALGLVATRPYGGFNGLEVGPGLRVKQPGQP